MSTSVKRNIAVFLLLPYALIPFMFPGTTSAGSMAVTVGGDRGNTSFDLLGQSTASDNSAARLDNAGLPAPASDAQMAALTTEQRLAVMDRILGKWMVLDDDERLLVRLIATTPPDEASSLISALRADNCLRLRMLDKAIDGDENVMLHRSLQVKTLQSLSPEELADVLENAKIFPWADPGMLGAVTNRRFFYEKVEITDDGKLHVEFWSNTALIGFKQKPIDIDPFELIGIRFYYDETRFNKKKGEYFFGPAVNLLTFKRKQNATELRTLVDVAFLFAGGMGFACKATKAAKIGAALQVSFVAADMLINECRAGLSQTKEGRCFLKSWDIARTVMAVYGAAQLITGSARSIFGRVRRRYIRIRQRLGASLPTAQRLSLEKRLNEMMAQTRVRGVCFAPDTAVATKSGSRAIADIRPGDIVLSRDTLTGRISGKPVVGTSSRKASKLVFLTIRGGGRAGLHTLVVTADHPFLESNGQWKRAACLLKGDHLWSVGAKSAPVVVVLARTRNIPTTVYNIAVKDWSTYFVSPLGVLVHNNDCAATVVTAGKKFKDHFIRHKKLLENVLGTKYPKYKSHGAAFLEDVSRAINNGTVKYAGKGTLKMGQPPCKIYRGSGITIVTRLDDEFVTILESGKGMDLAIRMQH